MATGAKGAVPLLATHNGTATETTPLVAEEMPTETPMPLWWNVVHFVCFFIGGSTFIAGSISLAYPNWPPSAKMGAALYIIGSFGFLGVDLLEFFTFTDNRLLRSNIALSAIGSALYVIGSIGFVPDVGARYPTLGSWGFIWGSLFIGGSQLWKTYRIGCGGNERKLGFSVRHGLCASADSITQVGVELDAGVGAWFFFFSTVYYLQQGQPASGDTYFAVIALWIIGSCFFFFGSLFLGYRHFVMGA